MQELVSDTLSRSYLNNIKPEFDENTLIWYIHFNLLNLPISQSQLDLFYLETQKDQILQTVICYIVHGWQEKHKYGKSYFIITPSTVKLRTMNEFFWRTKKA